MVVVVHGVVRRVMECWKIENVCGLLRSFFGQLCKIMGWKCPKQWASLSLVGS